MRNSWSRTVTAVFVCVAGGHILVGCHNDSSSSPTPVVQARPPALRFQRRAPQPPLPTWHGHFHGQVTRDGPIYLAEALLTEDGSLRMFASGSLRVRRADAAARRGPRLRAGCRHLHGRRRHSVGRRATARSCLPAERSAHVLLFGCARAVQLHDRNPRRPGAGGHVFSDPRRRRASVVPRAVLRRPPLSGACNARVGRRLVRRAVLGGRARRADGRDRRQPMGACSSRAPLRDASGTAHWRRISAAPTTSTTHRSRSKTAARSTAT